VAVIELSAAKQVARSVYPAESDGLSDCGWLSAVNRPLNLGVVLLPVQCNFSIHSMIFSVSLVP
jgi:hypothetical protein